jgi:SagB-type dehydrogenase family enzyme
MKPAVQRVDAEWMGHAFARDRDLRLPERPRIIPELLVLPFGGDGAIFFGAEDDQVVGGRSARRVVEELRRHADGTRTLAELATVVPSLSAEHLRSALTLLASRGLLEEGEVQAPAAEDELGDTRAWLGRFVDVTRSNRNRDEALERLRTSRVRLLGPATLLHALGRELEAAGVPLVDAGPTLTVAVSDEQTPPPTGTGPVFSVRLGAEEAEVGPLLAPGRSACPRCFARMHPQPRGVMDPDRARYFISHAGLQIVQLLAAIAQPALAGTFRAYRFDQGELVSEQRHAPPLPGCSACGIGGPMLAPDDPRLLAWIYHWSTVLPVRECVTPKAHQMHYRIANVELAREAKAPWRRDSGVRLPEPDPLTASRSWNTPTRAGAEAPTLAELATVLHAGAGEVGEGADRRRLAPTGGNLGSVDLWVAARRVSGLAPGVYHYDPPRHRLERVAPLPGDRGAPAEIIGTGALARCAQKYGAFAYRLMYCDSGVALAHLHAAAAALGLCVREDAGLDELCLARTLGFAAAWERPLPTFVLLLGAAEAPPAAAPRVAQRPATLARRAYSESVLDLLLDETARSAALPPGPSSPAPSRPRALAPLGSVLRRRRAVREYRAEAVDGSLASDLALEAALFLRERVAGGAAACFVRPRLAVARPAADLESGLYEVDVDAGRIVWRGQFSPQAMRRANNQHSLGEAPCALFFVGDFAAAIDAHGARGYRVMAQHAGAAAGHSWLHATALGLGGTAAGGVIVGGLREAAPLEVYRECPLLAFHFGLPAEGMFLGA